MSERAQKIERRQLRRLAGPVVVGSLAELRQRQNGLLDALAEDRARIVALEQAWTAWQAQGFWSRLRWLLMGVRRARKE